MLWDTLQAVKNDEIKPTVANSVATQSREICRVIKMQIEVEKMGIGKNTKNRLIK